MKKKKTQLYIFIKRGRYDKFDISTIISNICIKYKHLSYCFPFLYAQCKLFDVQTFIFLSKISNENITEINETVLYIYELKIWFEHF